MKEGSTAGLLIVEERSAAHLCTEPLETILENHISIVKPENTKSESYIAFKNAYRRSVDPDLVFGK